MNACATARGVEAYPEPSPGSMPSSVDPQTSLFRRQGEDSFLEYVQRCLVDRRDQPRRSTRPLFEPIHGMPPVNFVESAAESLWLSEHASEVEHAYRGEWLLIDGDQLLHHSSNFADIRQHIISMGLQSPFVYFVPEEGNTDFIA